MISIKRVDSGKISHLDFAKDDLVSSGWELSPTTNRFYIDRAEKALNIKHGSFPAYLLRDLPDNAVLEMKNTYNPTISQDVGGLVAYEIDGNKLELYEYYHPGIGTDLSYPYVRLVKKGTDYAGYGSQDGNDWDIRGATEFKEARKWGVCLEGIDGQLLKIHSLSVYKDTKIDFRAIPSGGRVEAWHVPTGTLIESKVEELHEAELDMFNYPNPVSVEFKVYSRDNELVSTGIFEDVFGGDVFHCGNFLEVYYEGEPLDLMNNDFGYIDSFFKDYKLELRNMISTAHLDVNIEIKKYMEEFGWEWVKLSKDVGGVPGGDFNNVLTIDEVAPNGSVFFWIRITRSSVPVYVNDYLFDFVINVW